jgi:hypothetical protein
MAEEAQTKLPIPRETYRMSDMRAQSAWRAARPASAVTMVPLMKETRREPRNART